MTARRTVLLWSPLALALSYNLAACLEDYAKLDRAGSGGAGASSSSSAGGSGGTLQTGGNGGGGGAQGGGGPLVEQLAQFGSSLYDGEPDLAALDDGTSSLVGTFEGDFSIGGPFVPASCAGARCMFVARHDSSGATPVALTSASGDIAQPHVAMNAQGVAVAGHFSSSMSGLLTLAQDSGATEAAFVAGLTAEGTAAVWTQRVGDAGTVNLNAVALANDDKVLVAGDYDGQIDSLVPAGLCDLVNTTGTPNLVALAFSNGVCLWKLGASETPTTSASVVGAGWDASNKAYLGLNYDGNLALGVNSFTSTAQDIIVARLGGATGSLEVSNDFGGAGSDALTAMHVSSTGRVTVAGKFANAIDFGGASTPLTNVTGSRLFVASLDSGLSGRWAVSIDAATANTTIRDVTVAANGAVIVVGGFEGTLDFGTTSLTSSSGVDAFIAGFTDSGNLAFAIQGGGTGNDFATSVAVTATHIHFAGEFHETFQIGDSLALTNLGSEPDIFFGTIAL